MQYQKKDENNEVANYIATGFLAGKGVILTSAHVVKDIIGPGIFVYPHDKLNPNAAVLIKKENMEMSPDYKVNSTTSNDYAILYFDNKNLKNYGYCSLMDPYTNNLKGIDAEVAGYPGEVRGQYVAPKMYKHNGKVTADNEKTVFSDIDTSGGNSGGPWFSNNKVFAIHSATAKNNTHAIARKIDNEIYGKIKEYRSKDEPSTVTGWKQEGKNWYYYENNKKTTGWKTIKTEKYYFNTVGVMQIGWQEISDNWYFFSGSGGMTTGWKSMNGNYYYLDKNTGIMKTGWLTESGNKYYLMPKNGRMATSWLKLNGKDYYFNGSGRMVTGKYTRNGDAHEFNNDGIWIGRVKKMVGYWKTTNIIYIKTIKNIKAGINPPIMVNGFIWIRLLESCKYLGRQ